jgi:hypothetical protein
VGQSDGKKKREPKLPWSPLEVVDRQLTKRDVIKLSAEHCTHHLIVNCHLKHPMVLKETELPLLLHRFPGSVADPSPPHIRLTDGHSSSLCLISGKINVINTVLITKPINPSHIPCGINMDNDRAKMIVLTTKARPKYIVSP